MSADDTQVLAKQILETIPVVMRTLAFELRGGQEGQHDMVAPHFRLLWVLKRRSLTLSELAERQLVSLPTMSNSVTILEDRGWVMRTRSHEDRRKVFIELSTAGQSALEHIERQAQVRLAQHLTSLSSDDRQKLLEGLSVLRAAFLPDETCPAEEHKT